MERVLGSHPRPHLLLQLILYIYNTKIVCCHSVAALCLSSYHFGDERWVGRVEVKLITRVVQIRKEEMGTAFVSNSREKAT